MPRWGTLWTKVYNHWIVGHFCWVKPWKRIFSWSYFRCMPWARQHSSLLSAATIWMSRYSWINLFWDSNQNSPVYVIDNFKRLFAVYLCNNRSIIIIMFCVELFRVLDSNEDGHVDLTELISATVTLCCRSNTGTESEPHHCEYTLNTVFYL